MVARELRLRSPIDFERARSQGKSWTSPFIVAVVMPNGREANRYGFAAGRRVGGAVGRNRAKRMMRETVRNLHPRLDQGFDIVFIARNKVGPDTSQAEIDASTASVLQRAGLLSKGQLPGPDLDGGGSASAER